MSTGRSFLLVVGTTAARGSSRTRNHTVIAASSDRIRHARHAGPPSARRERWVQASYNNLYFLSINCGHRTKCHRASAVGLQRPNCDSGCVGWPGSRRSAHRRGRRPFGSKSRRWRPLTAPLRGHAPRRQDCLTTLFSLNVRARPHPRRRGRLHATVLTAGASLELERRHPGDGSGGVSSSTWQAHRSAAGDRQCKMPYRTHQ